MQYYFTSSIFLKILKKNSTQNVYERRIDESGVMYFPLFIIDKMICTINNQRLSINTNGRVDRPIQTVPYKHGLK